MRLNASARNDEIYQPLLAGRGVILYWTLNTVLDAERLVERNRPIFLRR